jgi:2-octaprenyl-6-methoxyphenol hydroxylase
MRVQSPAQQYDISIVGAGMVGCVLALALAPSVQRIALMDRFLPDVDRAPNSASRPLTLNAVSVASLQTLGVWDQLESVATPIRHVHVSQAGYLGTCQFTAKEMDVDALGYVVPADCLAHALIVAAMALPQVEFFCIEKLEAMTQTPEGVSAEVVHAKQAKHIASHFLFGCDGTHSTVAELIGAQYQKNDATIMALLCDLQQAGIGASAYERFTDHGTLALLPKPNGAAGLVFTGSEKQVDALMARDDVAFTQTIQDMMRGRLSRAMQGGKRLVRPLESGEYVPLSQGRILLLGNAARTLYPIAAQGFNLGLRDVMQLQAVFACAADYDTPFDVRIIDTFLAMREEDQQGTQSMVQRIGKLFDFKFPGFSHLRSIGMMSVSAYAPFKHKLAQRALGMLGKAQRVTKLKQHESAEH